MYMYIYIYIYTHVHICLGLVLEGLLRQARGLHGAAALVAHDDDCLHLEVAHYIIM